VSTTSQSFTTASGDMWVTAFEYLSSSGSSYNQSLLNVDKASATGREDSILKAAQRRIQGKVAILRAVKENDVDKVATLLKIDADLSV